MKKSIIIASLALVLSLAGCGQDAAKSPATQPEGTQQESGQSESRQDEASAGTEVESQEKLEKWVTKEMEDPAIPNTAIRMVNIVEGLDIGVGTTPFDYDFAEIEQALRANAYISQNYDLRIEDREDFRGEAYAEGEFFKCIKTQKITGTRRGEDRARFEEYEDFWFEVKWDFSEYDNISSITMGFKDVEPIPQLQEEMYQILKDTLGEELAEYMVYAYQEEGKHDGMEKYIVTDDGTYYGIKRDVSYSSKDETWDVEFSLFMNYLGVYNKFEYYHGDYVPMVKDAPYNVSALTNGGMEDFDIYNFSTFGAEYANIVNSETYTRTKLTNGVYEEHIADDGEKSYFISIMANTQMMDLAVLAAPSITITGEVAEKDGEITYIHVSLSGSDEDAFSALFNGSEDVALKKRLAIMKEQMDMVLPGVDLSEVTEEALEENSGRLYLDTTVTVLGKECECDISVNADGRWSLTYKYE